MQQELEDVEKRVKRLLDSRRFKTMLTVLGVVFVLILLQDRVDVDVINVIYGVFAIGIANVLGYSLQDYAEASGINFADGISRAELEKIIEDLLQSVVDAVKDPPTSTG